MDDFHSLFFALDEEPDHIYIDECYLFQVENGFVILLNLFPQFHDVIQMKVSNQMNSGRLTSCTFFNLHVSIDHLTDVTG